MSDLLCEWCGGPRSPKKQHTCSSKCRVLRWRWLRGETRGINQLPPIEPPWAGSPLHGRMGEDARSNTGQVAAVATPGPRSGTNARSGLILSYPKAVKLVALALLEDGYAADEGEAGRWAETVLTDTLSSKMRARLEARDGE